MALIDKLKKMEEEKKATAETVRARVELWKGAVKRLLDRIEQDFDDLKREGLAQFTRESIRLTEDYTGSYGTERLRMTVGGGEIVFEPVALYIIGAAGRVDLYPRGLRNHGFMLFRIGDSNDWRISPMEVQPGGKRETQPFDRQILEQVIETFIQNFPNVFRS